MPVPRVREPSGARMTEPVDAAELQRRRNLRRGCGCLVALVLLAALGTFAIPLGILVWRMAMGG